MPKETKKQRLHRLMQEVREETKQIHKGAEDIEYVMDPKQQYNIGPVTAMLKIRSGRINDILTEIASL